MKQIHSLLKEQTQQSLSKDSCLDDSIQKFISAINDTYYKNELNQDSAERLIKTRAKELAHIKSYLKAIFQENDLLFRTDHNFHILEYVAGENNKLLNSTAGVINQEINTLLFNESKDPFLEHVKRTINDNTAGLVSTAEYTIKQAEVILKYEVRIASLPEEQLLIIMLDITKRKTAEEEINQHKQKLETQNQILFEITEHSRRHEDNIEDIFSEITKAAAETLDTDRVSVWLYNENRNVINCTSLYDKDKPGHAKRAAINVKDYPVYFRSLVEGRAIAASNARIDSRTSEFLDDYLIPFNVESMLDAPIRSGSEHIGFIRHEQIKNTRQWTAEEQQFAASMADIVSLACETHAHQLSQQSLLESEERFRILAETTDSAIFAFSEKFLYVNPSMETISGYSEQELLDTKVSDLFGNNFFTGIKNKLQDPSHNPQTAFHQEVEITTKTGEKRWLYIAIGQAQFDKQSAYLASAFDISQRRLIEEQLRFQAFHDKLTGLPNRALFIDRLDRCLAYTKRQKNYQCAVLFLDVDRFKVLNDSLGHVVGDELLIEIGNRLTSVIREIDTVARMGGDEFTVLLEHFNDMNELVNVARRIQESLTRPFLVAGQEVYSSASIGIAIGDSSYQKPEHVLRDADIAMYRAKENGKACHEIFDTQMRTRAKKLLQLETDLHHAIKHHEFKLYYQPIISLKTGQTIGFEGLIRWFKNDKSIILPAEFIPLSEESGLIIPLGHWVIEEACKQLQKWQSEYPEVDLTINVNLSGKQFQHIDLISDIQQLIGQYDISPGLLKLEITESMIMENSTITIDKLHALKSLGVELLMDDFGTGYSSLSYLHQFPIDALKIDRSFVANVKPNNKNIGVINAIISLAHNLGLKVVAEGVEQTTHLRLLKKLQCEFAQGHYFSKPVPLAKADTQINKTWRLDDKDSG